MSRPRRRAPKKPEGYNIRWEWHWRSLAAVVYLAICVFDLVGMPTYREMTYNKLSVHEMVKISKTMDKEAQVETLKILKEDRKWSPLTDEMFHIAFGAILGVSALPMNRRRKFERDDHDDDYNDGGQDPDTDAYHQTQHQPNYGAAYSAKKPPSEPEPEVLE